MERRSFGATGLMVSPLGLGGSEIGFGEVADRDVDRIVGAALEAGVNVFDTAECYRESEAKLGRALAGRRDDVLIFTKCGHRFVGGPEEPDWSPALLAASLENSLRALRTDRVDLLQLHSCPREALERGDVVRFVQDAKAAGKARLIGYSGDGEAAAWAAESGVFDALQMSLNVADQQNFHLALPIARRRGLGVIAKRPVANTAWLRPDLKEGDYAWPYAERLRALAYPFLHDDPADAVAAALRFTVFHPGVSVAIAGASRPERLEANAASIARGPLPEVLATAIAARWTEVAPPDWAGLT